MKREGKLAKQLMGGSLFIGLTALITYYFDITSFSFAVEFLIVGIGILVTVLCLLFLINEHRHKVKERALFERLVTKIHQQKLSPLSAGDLISALETHLSPLDSDQRLKMLQTYLKNPTRFLKRLDEPSLV